MPELTAWCMGSAPHPGHSFGSGEWCPGLRDPEMVTYELRPESSYLKMPVVTLSEGRDEERFPQAVKMAEQLSGSWAIWRYAPAASMSEGGEQSVTEHYIVSSGPYWRDSEGRSHQIGSKGACWDCYQETCQPVRHPITPGEVLTGQLLPCSLPDDDPCIACGGGYRYWVIGEPPSGWAYEEHHPMCPILSGEMGEEDFKVKEAGK